MDILSPGPLTIPFAQLSDEGIYRCRVSVKGAGIEKPVQINVIGKQITIHVIYCINIIIKTMTGICIRCSKKVDLV